MAKVVKSDVYDFFTITPDSARCKKCHTLIKTVQSCNLKRHLKSCQLDEWKKLQEKEGPLLKSSSTPINTTPKTFFEERKLSEDEKKLQETGYSKLAAMPQVSINFLRSNEFISFVRGYKRAFKVCSFT